MNQSHVVGIGNIYANEILFDVGIRPTKRSKLITKKQSLGIAASAKKFFEELLKLEGQRWKISINQMAIKVTLKLNWLLMIVKVKNA